MQTYKPPSDLLPYLDDRIVQDQSFRRQLARSLEGFCKIYLSHHFPLVPAKFARDMLSHLQDHSQKRLEIIGFRGSAKSTFTNVALILWAALEHPDKYPFIISISDGSVQAGINMESIRYELETNELLNLDYGKMKYRSVKSPTPEPMLESDDEWQKRNIVLDNGVRIIGRGRGQKVRGMKHRQHRPSLVVADDVENLDSIATQEQRDKTDKWFRGEVMGAMEVQQGRIVVIGNWLHTNGLMARLKDTGRFNVLEYALFDDNGVCTWPEMYPTQKSLDDKRTEMGDTAWFREMMLRIVPEEGQDVTEEDIHYYDEPPFDDGNFIADGVDLAISTKESADYTAVVSGEITWPNGKLQIYVQPDPVNKHMNFNDSMAEFDEVRHKIQHSILREWHPGDFMRTGEYTKDMPDGRKMVMVDYTMEHKFFVEAVQYQQVAIEEMERRGFDVVAIRPIKDKRSRLRVAARYIKRGDVLFPRRGCEKLLQQLLSFGIEKHDDLVDALVYMILGVAGDSIESPTIHHVERPH